MEEDKLPDANEAFCRMLGYTKGELVGKTPFEFGAEEFRHFLRTNQGMTPFKEYRKFEGFLKSNNDGRIPILIHGSKLRDDSGKSIGNMAFITDLTEQKKALAPAAEVQKSLLPQYGVNIPGGYDADDFLRKYIAFMTKPGNHRDTYVEEYHRNFFANYAKGLPPRKCGVEEKHIGGLIGLIPVVLFYFNQADKAHEAALAHLALTHPGMKMETAGSLIIDILLKVLSGNSLNELILEGIEAQKNPLLGHPFTKLINEPDDRVIGPRFSPSCYVEDSVPAVVYLALKYHDDRETALIANTNLGETMPLAARDWGLCWEPPTGLRNFPLVG